MSIQNNKEIFSIVIVDSGMGGLSICADVVEGLKKKSGLKEATITYFNAWPVQNRGYNRLADDAERTRVFDNALNSVQQLNPDLILIACNTLSILYPQTKFAKTTTVPVHEIVSLGVRLTKDHLVRYPESGAIIFGTLTTANSGAHKSALMAEGISGDRVINQACDQLATQIENGPESELVEKMIDEFVAEAAANLGNSISKGFAVLCCTHFGYAKKLFDQKIKKYLGEGFSILNPNHAMVDQVLDLFTDGESTDTKIKIDTLSRIFWDEVKTNAIAEALSAISPETAEALRNYHQDPDLFQVS